MGEVPEPEARLRLDNFPALPSSSARRPLYFGEPLHPDDKKILEERGYAPRQLFELPRGTPQAEIDYLLAKAQALEEGTAPYKGKVDVMLVELQMKANRMLTDKSPNLRVNLTVGKRDVKEFLESWGQSRHTLRGNTTIQNAQASLKPGPKEVPADAAPKKKRKKR